MSKITTRQVSGQVEVRFILDNLWYQAFFSSNVEPFFFSTNELETLIQSSGGKPGPVQLSLSPELAVLQISTELGPLSYKRDLVTKAFPVCSSDTTELSSLMNQDSINISALKLETSRLRCDVERLTNELNNRTIIYGHQYTKEGLFEPLRSPEECDVLRITLGSGQDRYHAKYYQEAIASIKTKCLHLDIGFNCGKNQHDAIKNSFIESIITSYKGQHHDLLVTILENASTQLPNLQRIVFTSLTDVKPLRLSAFLKRFNRFLFIYDEERYLTPKKTRRNVEEPDAPLVKRARNQCVKSRATFSF